MLNDTFAKNQVPHHQFKLREINMCRVLLREKHIKADIVPIAVTKSNTK